MHHHCDMNHISNGVWIGSHHVLKSAHFLTAKGIKNVINAAIEFITETPELINWDDLQRNGIEVHNTYWDDTMTQPIFPSASLETAVKKMDEVVKQGRHILVNCAVGKSRSTSLVIAYLMARQGMTYDQALSTCKRSRPICQPNPNFEKQLRQLESSLRVNDNAKPEATRISAPLSPRTPVTPASNSVPPFQPSPQPPSQLYCNPYTSSPASSLGGSAKPFSPTFNAGQSTLPRFPQSRAPGSPLASPSSYSVPSHSEPKSPARVTPASPPVSPGLGLGQRYTDSASSRLPYASPNYGDQSRLASPRGASGLKSPFPQAGVQQTPFNSPYNRSLPSPASGLGQLRGGSPFTGTGTGTGSPYNTGTYGAAQGTAGLNTHNRGHPSHPRGMDYMSPLRRRLSL